MEKPGILYEDNHIIAVNKPAGWLVQGDHTGDLTLLDWCKTYIKNKYDKPGAVFLGCIHRIDRPVSGVVLFARTSKALERMNAMLAKKEIKKTYIAATERSPMPESGELEHYLSKDNERNRSFVVPARDVAKHDAKLCQLKYETIGKNERGIALLKIHPLTGRPHQIRVQLSTIGCPIVGDIKYQASAPLPDLSIALHCLSMEFVHPVTKTHTVVSSVIMPPTSVLRQFQPIIDALGMDK